FSFNNWRSQTKMKIIYQINRLLIKSNLNIKIGSINTKIDNVKEKLKCKKQINTFLKVKTEQAFSCSAILKLVK
ncbi:hypothetical protein, partial [Borreliella afzelii]